MQFQHIVDSTSMNFSETVPRSWISRTPGINDQGSLSPIVYELIMEILKIFFSFNPDSDDPVRSQICTCHDSWAVVTCAKLWSDHMIIFRARAIRNFCEIWIMSSKTVCKMDTRFGKAKIRPFLAHMQTLTTNHTSYHYNPLHAELLWENLKIYLHHKSYLILL